MTLIQKATRAIGLTTGLLLLVPAVAEFASASNRTTTPKSAGSTVATVPAQPLGGVKGESSLRCYFDPRHGGFICTGPMPM
jgi:hypothetical protein